MNEFLELMRMSILGAIPQTFAYILFVMSFLRPEPRNLIRRVAILTVIHSIYTDTMQLFLPLPFHVINSILALYLFIMLLFRDLNHKQKSSILLCTFVFAAAMDLVMTAISKFILDIDLHSELITDQFLRFLPYVWGEVLILIFATLLIRAKFNNRFRTYITLLIQGSQSYLRALIVLLLLQFILLGMLNFVQLDDGSNKPLTTTIIIYAVVVISLVALVLIARLIIRTREQAVQTTQDIYVEDINRMFASVRGQRHDFINHLQVIHTMSQMNKTSDLQKYVRDLVHETQEMSEIVNHASPALAAFVQAKATVAIAKGIAFSFDLPQQPGLQESSIRTIDIIKILGNLVDNAFDEVSLLPSGKRFVRGSVKYEDHFLVMEVANMGKVLSLEEQKMIFTAGFTTKKIGKHAGLGLAIVSERIKHYGGTLELHSDESNGTVFRITIMQPEISTG